MVFYQHLFPIPITRLNDLADLQGRILGFHFYNPPAVQRLVELITISGNSAAMIDFAKAYAKNLRKVVVSSNDVAGFIGNGHFMRDALHGIAEAKKLIGKFGFAQAVYIVNKVTQDFLLRPMGIFQLIDYVGVDVVRFIMAVMNPYHENENLHSPLLDKLFDQGVKGGQHSDGSQKDGFMKYEKGKPVAIYDIDKKQYLGIDALAGDGDEFLGALPDGWQPWKAVNFNKEKDRLLAEYFEKMQQMKTTGAEMAISYNGRSREIGNGLVARGVANNAHDVNTVMLTGFFHAYGPVNSY